MISNRKRGRVLLTIIAILFIANIGMLIFFTDKRGPERPPEHQDRKAFIANFLEKEIGFNKQQLAAYDTLSNLRRDKINKLSENMRNNKTIQFRQLATLNFSDSAINLIADQSAALQKTNEVDMFNHIKNIRLLCTPEQLPKFDSLFIKVFNRKKKNEK